MNAAGIVVVASLVGMAGVWLVVTGWREPRPSLASTIRRVRTGGGAERFVAGEATVVERLGAAAERWPAIGDRLVSPTTVRLIGRTREHHLGLLTLAALAGFVVPPLLVASLTAVDLVPLTFTLPLGLSLLGAIVAPAIVQLGAVAEAERITNDLRHQLSAYLDMVTMLLAGNTGHEGALEQAAAVGDGLLFQELRRRMREASTTGDSLVVALASVADDYGLVELEQVASSTALSAAEGAPVARTLAAKCSTLRSTLAADQEATARVRNDKVTPPLVGMALLFMALIIYPALDLG